MTPGWMAAGKPCAKSVREESSITKNTSRFLRHAIVGS
jgi:glutathionylspermidine synthase